MTIKVPVWAEVNLKSVAHNTKEICRIVSPGVKVMAIVKANAYGHGAAEVARVVLDNGVDRLGVARISEAEELRKAGIDTPILLLGYTPYEQFPDVLRLSLAQTIYSLETARALNGVAGFLGQKATVHIKIDTGMGRLGWQTGDSDLKEVLQVARLSNLFIEGIFTHFSAADRRDKTYTLEQFSRFTAFLEKLKKEGLEIPLKHCANSAAIIDLPQTHLNMVRPGIAIYGLCPSVEVLCSRIDLRPAMTFKTRVAYVKKVPAGFKVSYGATYQTQKPTIIATLPVGYADGYSRFLSSKGKVLVHGQRAQVLGVVCMDHCMIDVGHIDGVSAGDEVVLFGYQGDSFLPVEEIARDTGTINYEVVCKVSSRVPRVYLS